MVKEFYAYHTEVDYICRLSEISGSGSSLCTEISTLTFRELRSDILYEDINTLRIRLEDNPFELIFDDINSIKVMLELQN